MQTKYHGEVDVNYEGETPEKFAQKVAEALDTLKESCIKRILIQGPDQD